MRVTIYAAMAWMVLPVMAAERIFNFSEMDRGASPTNFLSLVAGRGNPGTWRIIDEAVPPTLAPLTSKAIGVASRAVLAQESREPLTSHLPMLIYQGDTFRDFKFATRFKLMGGALDQSAGLIFHFQNTSNFYLVRASAVAGNFRCSRVVDGEVKPPIGPDVPLSKGEWHEMSVECEGPRITCALDGQELVKLIDTASATAGGRVGFCTPSDSVAHFADARVVYTPTEILAAKIARDTLQEYSRLVGLKIYAARTPQTDPVVVGSGDIHDLNQPGTTTEKDVIRNGHSYVGRGKETITVVLPLRDRNGDVMAAVSIEMKKFLGQTEDNALVRAQPILRKLQSQVQSLDELLE